MAIITRLQLWLVRLGLTSVTLQLVVASALLSAVLLTVLRWDGLDVQAKSEPGSPLAASLLPKPLNADLQWTVEWAEAAASDAAEDLTTNASKTEKSAPVGTENGEKLFLQAYQLQQQGDYAQALQVAEKMVQRYPNFQLGQLLLGDLRGNLAGLNNTLTAWADQPTVQRRLEQLQAEAQLRTRHPAPAFFEGKHPAPVRYLSPAVSHVVLVDARKSRLYVLAQEPRAHAEPGKTQLRLIFDAYVSVGNNGVGKKREGDAKTPVGVYFTQKKLTDPMLPDLYGSGALTLNYPSPIDKLQKRTGSGIWLHGSPSQQYNRPPTATDGCVVLANDDMTRLMQLGMPPGTPVVITEQLIWLDTAPSMLTFAGTDANPGQALSSAQWPMATGQDWPQTASKETPKGGANLVSAFQWVDQQQKVAVLSYDRKTSSTADKRLHTYWVLQGQQWQEVQP